ncbi:MAG: hypothetical protein JWM04_1134 [Verrucomicrobiales bacterium]|nr:hypothetical protein [Verrucomicrobiales bacterium]
MVYSDFHTRVLQPGIPCCQRAFGAGRVSMAGNHHDSSQFRLRNFFALGKEGWLLVVQCGIATILRNRRRERVALRHKPQPDWAGLSYFCTFGALFAVRGEPSGG